MTERAPYTPQQTEPATAKGGVTVAASTVSKKTADKRGLRRYDLWAIVSFVVVVIAWVLMMYQGYVALAVAVPAVIAAFFGYKSRKAILRYLSVVTIIAGLVLIVVMLAFITVFSIVIETI